MSFELWDTNSGNLVRSYATVEEALRLVRSAVTSYGRRYVSHWALVALGPDGTLETVATGAMLATRAAELKNVDRDMAIGVAGDAPLTDTY